jgi:hypothetical protein
MFSELARVFSSQGVLIQGTQYAPSPRRTNPPVSDSGVTQSNPPSSPQFEQVSAILELSKQAQESGAEVSTQAAMDARTSSVVPAGVDTTAQGRNGYGSNPSKLGTTINLYS